MSNIARVEQQVIARDVSPMLSMIERAARDPSVDMDKMERLVQMKVAEDKRQAQASFDAAMADLQPELPTIGERGKAVVQGQTRYTFALWEDINAAIKPVLMKHGFALTFRTSFADGITVTGVLSHRAGHREETSITLPSDSSGSKNAVQAVASSVSYGKRYTAGALLNLTSHGEDDDAYRAAVETISEEQEILINDMLEATGSDKAKFLKWLKVERVIDIPAKSFDSVMVTLKAKERAK
ncbi:ERF family protein [Rhodanobacter glycinis]|uniref:ERF family protein n=1 Tax=Rhodanobacter glycinis TaxID=582702 RepID=UPI0019D60C2F|nr:ERF family protein [Rhodanobacter glycinis]